jgi:oxygen-independent coproporphyrinogen-3 oxidase
MERLNINQSNYSSEIKNGPTVRSKILDVNCFIPSGQPMVSTGVYIHIPFCRAKCDYCGFYSVPLPANLEKTALVDGYVRSLCSEIEARSGLVSGQVDTIFFGGGSPSYLDADQFSSVFETVKRSFSIADDAEITVEINPSDLERDIIPMLCSSGVNRLSMGVQTLDRDLYAAIGRKGGFCDDRTLERYFSIPGVQHCADIIGGLPAQTPQMLLRDLEQICSYKPDHLSLYLLTLEDGSPLSRRLVPDERFDLAQKESLDAGIRFLVARGYEHYEVSNFALPLRRSRHNMKYWTFQPYIGFGAGAHSFIGGERAANKADVFAYMSGADSETDRNTPALRMAEYIMTSLRLSEGFSTDQFKMLFGEGLPDAVWEAVFRLSKEGRVNLCAEGDSYRISICDESFFFSDSVIFSMVEPLL